MLNTTQVKQLVKQRFGDYAKCYVNKCKYDNKRNLAFVMETNLTDAQLDALSSQAETLENNAIAVANRQKEYGTPQEMIEYITENGLEAWQTKVQGIKTKYKKESE